MNRINNVLFLQKAFIISDGKVLIAKRKEEKMFSGMWDIPGGKLEDNESLYTGIKREVLEETGLEITDILCTLSSILFVASIGDKPTIFRNLYLCKATGEITLSSEHSEYLWVDPKDLKNYEFPDHNDLKYVVENLAGIIEKMGDKEFKVSKVF